MGCTQVVLQQSPSRKFSLWSLVEAHPRWLLCRKHAYKKRTERRFCSKWRSSPRGALRPAGVYHLPVVHLRYRKETMISVVQYHFGKMDETNILWLLLHAGGIVVIAGNLPR